MEGSDILTVMLNFNKNLYNSKSLEQDDALDQYLSIILIPKLTESKQLLEQPLTCLEVEKALQMAPNENAPGQDF